jgi:hypothetical protein
MLAKNDKILRITAVGPVQFCFEDLWIAIYKSAKELFEHKIAQYAFSVSYLGTIFCRRLRATLNSFILI